MNLGVNIRKNIKEAGLKQIEVCKATGLSPSRLSNYLSDSREPDFETIGKICDFLGIRIDDLRHTETERHPAEDAMEALDNSLESPVLFIKDSITGKTHRIPIGRDTARSFLSSLLSTDKKEVSKCHMNLAQA